MMECVHFNPVMKKEYDQKIRFHNRQLFCYSKKKFKRETQDKNVQIIGEIIEKEKSTDESKVTIHSKQHSILKYGTKSRLLYREAGYLSLGEERYVVVLKSRLLIFLLFLFLLLLIGIAVAVFQDLHARETEAPIVLPLSVDSSEESIEDDASVEQESEKSGGSVRLTYSLDAELSLSTGNIRIYFLNPGVSNHDIALSLYIVDGENTIKIAESGLVQAGYGLENMQFIENAAVLSEGSYMAMFGVSFYDPETGEKALVESNIPDVQLEVLP